MRLILQRGHRTVLCLLLLLLCSSVQVHAQDLGKLASDLAAKIHAKQRGSVTVMDFVDLEKKSNKLTKLMTYQLQSALTAPENNLVVVDQSHVAELFDQMDKLSEGLIDPATAKMVGKMTGTEVIVVGTVMVSSMSVRVDVSAIDLETAKVIAAGSASPKRYGVVDRLATQVEEGENGAASGQGSPASSGSVGQAKNMPKPPARSRRDQGLLFELNGCSLSGDDVTCAMTITSEGRDRTVVVGSKTRAWNEVGEEFATSAVTIANSRDDNCISKELLRDVPTVVSATFSRFGGSSTTVERFRLAWGDPNYSCYGERFVDFEKIEVISDADFSAPQKSKGSVAAGASAVGSQKGSGGLLGRLTNKILDTAASTVEKMIDKKAAELTGDDEPPL